jgi:hypothetical protein
MFGEKLSINLMSFGSTVASRGLRSGRARHSIPASRAASKRGSLDQVEGGDLRVVNMAWIIRFA